MRDGERGEKKLKTVTQIGFPKGKVKENKRNSKNEGCSLEVANFRHLTVYNGILQRRREWLRSSGDRENVHIDFLICFRWGGTTKFQERLKLIPRGEGNIERKQQGRKKK